MTQADLEAILVAACCFLVCCRAAAHVRHRNRYPAVQGRVEQASVTSKSTADGALHRLNISYGYSVAGKQYVGHSIGNFLGNAFHTRRGAEAAVKNRFPVGQPVVVRYNPKDPEESFIPQPSLPWNMVALLPLGVLLALVAKIAHLGALQ